ncbi:MAG TPA: LacI family DNA-binding transcriptional regulator [Opitutaceae bacterium]|nr:LacI family DNA-binding transcriptional regulator [Opitutaceae bacterium]
MPVSTPGSHSSSSQPPTFRVIARAAGVSQMTVSRALGNRERVAESTRKRILNLAAKLGYRPDPEISKLMHYLRRGKRSQFQSVLCGLTDWPEGAKPPYFQELLEGVMDQARQRGYGFQLLQLTPSLTGPRLQRQLKGQGVQGILLLPLQFPRDLSSYLDWNQFAVVSASMSVLGPEASRAVPHHFINTLRLCRELQKLGYQRIGLVMTHLHDSRSNHAFSAAVMSESVRTTGRFVPPLIYQNTLGADFKRWFSQHRPDAIIARDRYAVDECSRQLRLKIPGRVGFAVISVHPSPTGVSPHGSTLAGIDEVPRQVGSAAVDLLAGLVERRVRGIPASPTSTLVSGRWQPGKSSPGR